MRSPLNFRVVVGSVLGAPRYPGEIVVYVADAANGVEWLFRHSGDGSAYPWRFISGSSLSVEGVGGKTYGTLEGTASTSGADLATAGPAITVPLAGDYDCEGRVSATHAAATNRAAVAIAVNAETGVWNTGMDFGTVPAANGAEVSIGGRRKRTGLLVGDVVKLRYSSSTTGSNAQFANRCLWVRPVRCA